MAEDTRATEWREWLALPEDERRRRLQYAREETDCEGYTDDALLAGKVLHGRSFGFTWEDVDDLRDIAREWGPRSSPARRLRKMAERIAALLPPRKS